MNQDVPSSVGNGDAGARIPNLFHMSTSFGLGHATSFTIASDETVPPVLITLRSPVLA
jgi:hypothetical protein